jgi:rubrerythrin
MPTGSTAIRAADTAKVLQNLQAAFTGESNAHIRYVAFAEQADKEGYGKIASLFRAAARAEEIHAANHAAIIKKLGATPMAKIDAPVVKSTRENLETAARGEEYERDVMYPDFISQAGGNAAALRTFNYALQAEFEHARLFRKAIANLEKMKIRTTYYVCAICGYTVEKVTFDKCPACSHPREKFEKVS